MGEKLDAIEEIARDIKAAGYEQAREQRRGILVKLHEAFESGSPVYIGEYFGQRAYVVVEGDNGLNIRTDKP